MEAPQKNKGTGKRVIDGIKIYSDNPAAIKKREQREKKKAENEEEFKQKNTEYHKNYRKSLRNKSKDDEKRDFGDINNINSVFEDDTININNDDCLKALHEELDRVYNNMKKCNITTEIVKMPNIIQKLVEQTRTTIIENESIDSMVDKMFEVSKHENNTKNQANRETFVKYFQRLKVIRKHVYSHKNESIPNNEGDGFNLIWLKDVDLVMDVLLNYAQFTKEKKKEYYSLTSIESYLNAVSGICRRLLGYEDAHKKYGEELKKIHAINEKRTKLNKLNKREENNYMPWSDILAFAKDIKKHRPIERILFSLYTLTPPRRINDYCLMKITPWKDEEERIKHNWFNPKEKIFEFNVYKTFSDYGRITLNVPTLLVSVINSWVKSEKIKPNNLLFRQQEENKAYQPNTFGNMVRGAFKAITGNSLGVNLLRHSKITEFEASHPILQERQDLAHYMSHSVSVQLRYSKHNRGANDIDIIEGDDEIDEQERIMRPGIIKTVTQVQEPLKPSRIRRSSRLNKIT